MKKANPYMNIYFVSGCFLVFGIIYLITYLLLTSRISGGSSLEIYHKQLEKEKLLKSRQ